MSVDWFNWHRCSLVLICFQKLLNLDGIQIIGGYCSRHIQINKTSSYKEKHCDQRLKVVTLLPFTDIAPFTEGILKIRCHCITNEFRDVRKI